MSKLVKKYQEGTDSGGVVTASDPQDSSDRGAEGRFGSVISGFMNSSNFKSGIQAAGGLMSMFPTPNADLNSNNLLVAAIRALASQALLQSGNPYAMAAGAAVMAIDKTGGFSDASQGLGHSNDTLNKVAALAIPGAGWFMGKTDSYKMSDDMKSMSSSYSGSVADGQTAMQNSGAKIMFGRRKAQKMIEEAKFRDKMISNIKQDTEDDLLAQQTMTLNLAMSNQLALNGGYQQGLARAAKKGGILTKIEKAKSTLNSIKLAQNNIPEVVPNDDEFFNSLNIEEFKQGGTLEIVQHTDDDFFNSLIIPVKEIDEVQAFQKGGELNVIPEGALHARMHHMEGAENLTKKGIPVVSEEKGGELEQQAEIEVNEIIFRLETTLNLEKFWKEYNKDGLSKSEKDAIAIEAGKLLAVEIMEKTEDRTGLIEQVV